MEIERTSVNEIELLLECCRVVPRRPCSSGPPLEDIVILQGEGMAEFGVCYGKVKQVGEIDVGSCRTRDCTIPLKRYVTLQHNISFEY